MPTQVHTGYIPREWQSRTHRLVKRHNVLVFHRRGGKTVFSVNEMIDRALRFDKRDPKTGEIFRNPTFAFVATTIGQVEKKQAWSENNLVQFFAGQGNDIYQLEISRKLRRDSENTAKKIAKAVKETYS